jgi:acyl-CoA synthetase (AMP-forming)/AMP-acid ligase II
MVFASPLPDVEIPDIALTEYVLARAAELGDKPALIDGGSGRTLTYAGLAQAARSLAGGLAAKGFGKGSTLALMSPNVPEYAVVFHGVALAGGTITTINPTYTASEIRKQLLDSKATILVTIPMFLEVATEGALDTSVTGLYVLGEAEGAMPVTALFGAPIDAQVPVSAEDVVVLPYSSGTTGLSKGVMLTHRNLVANVAQVLSGADIRDDETFIAVLPFFHIYGMQVLMNTGLRAGVTIVTMPRFDLEEFLRLHQQYGVTRSFVAPPIVVALAKHPMVDDYDLSALRQVFSGAAPLSTELAVECGARIGCDVVQGYGMTELSPVSHLTQPGNYKPGSCGVTAPNTLTMVVDPATQHELGVDEDGEICIKGPQVMLGYLGNQAATNAIFDREGWLHTGDIGHIDADGHLWIVDRLKELIKYNGFQVPPAELEALLLTHPAVADAAVVGVPDDEAGEIPVAYVVLRPGSQATPEEIQEFVAGQVAHYKQVRKVVLTDVIPKSASGKILRRVLRDQPPA